MSAIAPDCRLRCRTRPHPPHPSSRNRVSHQAALGPACTCDEARLSQFSCGPQQGLRMSTTRSDQPPHAIRSRQSKTPPRSRCSTVSMSQAPPEHYRNILWQHRTWFPHSTMHTSAMELLHSCEFTSLASQCICPQSWHCRATVSLPLPCSYIAATLCL